LLLRYQACPDVHGTESTGKEPVGQIPWHFTASELLCVVALLSGEQWQVLGTPVTDPPASRVLSSLQWFVVHVFPRRAQYLIPNIIIVCVFIVGEQWQCFCLDVWGAYVIIEDCI
jgi:hypothetical protein